MSLQCRSIRALKSHAFGVTLTHFRLGPLLPSNANIIIFAIGGCFSLQLESPGVCICNLVHLGLKHK